MADARFAVRFAIILVVLFTAELAAPVQHALVEPWTGLVTQGSRRVLDLFDPAVISYANVLASTRTGFAVSIEAGCNGVEAALVLLAAILAFRAPWRQKAMGMVAGLAAVQVLNVIRVVTLFYVGQWSPRAFEWAHLYVWQTLIIVDVLVVWLLWMRWVGLREPSGAPA
jgi:exosortase H (IPTLxxWG-CTERM-specific)